MTSLSDLVKSYKNKKIEATKRRRQAENKLKLVISLKRRSSSGLASLERRKENTTSKKGDIAQILNQYLAQRDSIQRLKISAEERLRQEQEARDQSQQQSEYAEPEERARALERLKIADDKIAELESEIKQRNHGEERLVKIIADLEKQKTKNEGELRNQSHSKPSLLVQLKSSTKEEERLRPHVQSLIKREEKAKSDLSKIIQRLELAKAAKRKADAKRRAEAKRRAAAKRKAQRKAAAKRRKVTKRSKTRTKKAAKRKMPKRKTPKRKTAKRKTPKRKAPKRKTKRKSSKKSKRARR
ncbi:MAG: ATPase V [Nitrosopumilaceae archaeon]